MAEIEERLEVAQFIAGGFFEVYRDGNQLIYFRDSCDLADIEARFFLHVRPVDLPAGRDSSYFDNHDFNFQDQGARLGRRCLAMVTLPDYQISQVDTGQFIRDVGKLWKVRFSMGQ